MNSNSHSAELLASKDKVASSLRELMAKAPKNCFAPRPLAPVKKSSAHSADRPSSRTRAVWAGSWESTAARRRYRYVARRDGRVRAQGTPGSRSALPPSWACYWGTCPVFEVATAAKPLALSIPHEDAIMPMIVVTVDHCPMPPAQPMRWWAMASAKTPSPRFPEPPSVGPGGPAALVLATAIARAAALGAAGAAVRGRRHVGDGHS